ncbi:Retrovirus-related Pol polyprotein from transposon TNT 1-94 [Vitis vinifera]|uniref:Retrovirus-related Pol polyprotein from transposon TNT 1-94 n=1 Tax=Vitis vinifera TaxID=29760 RepID=A0A438HHA6_VITVI|nr:Retrovirus-related Pol polyprotein from transposon TNT 1-94 [Vitis vinifera]
MRNFRITWSSWLPKVISSSFQLQIVHGLKRWILDFQSFEMDIVSEKDHIDAQPSTSSDRLIVIQNAPQVQTGDRQPIIEAPQIANDNPVDQVVQDSPEIVEQPVEQQLDYDIGAENDLETFSQAISCKESNLWYDAMKDEMNSMASNGVWNLVQLPNGAKAIGCKWVFKIKKDSLGNIKRYKGRLVAKGFTQNEGIDYKETFSPISKKDSLHIIMTLVAHFDLKLQQMDVKTTFLNGNLEEEVYMKQLERFSSNGGEHLVCKLKKSIYGLKQASCQWYLKFHDVISSFVFVENIMDQCIYQKVNGSKICFLVLYVDDILLATNNKGLLHEVKQFLSKNFDMKDMGDVTYVIGIEIQRDRFRGLLGLSQETYINKVLERFRMKDCSPSIAPIVKGDRFNLDQRPKNDLEREQMKNIPYASAVGSLMYVQVCTRPDIAFTVGMLGRYQSNPGMDDWKATKKVMRYLQGTKDYMLMYRRTDNLEVIGYFDSDYASCIDLRKSTSGYVFMLVGGAVS